MSAPGGVHPPVPLASCVSVCSVSDRFLTGCRRPPGHGGILVLLVLICDTDAHRRVPRLSHACMHLRGHRALHMYVHLHRWPDPRPKHDQDKEETDHGHAHAGALSFEHTTHQLHSWEPCGGLRRNRYSHVSVATETGELVAGVLLVRRLAPLPHSRALFCGSRTCHCDTIR